jgi:tRNA-specific 2-thiouridylase
MPESVAVAMSGGVDSSVAALLLKRDGYEVLGITLRLFSNGAGQGDNNDGAAAVARQLGIKHVFLDAADEFKKKVIENFVAK